MNGSSASSNKSNTEMVVNTSHIAYLKWNVYLYDAYESTKKACSLLVGGFNPSEKY